MTLFVEYSEDPGFQVRDNLCHETVHYIIIGIRDNGRGLWLTLRKL